jgi:type VII secretion integral membrane protein EccD
MPLCRLSVHAEYGEASRTVDMALPSSLSVHALLPAVVNLAGLPDPDVGEPTRWHLGSLSGTPLDLSLTLAENDVRDGDLLVLTPQSPPPPRHRGWDPCRTVSVASAPSSRGLVAEMACGWALVAGAVTLAWTGLSADRVAHLVVAAVAAGVALALAISAPRPTLRVAAVAVCAATGFLAVPAGPAAANAFLAAVAACSAAALLARWTDPWSTTLMATGAFSGVIALSIVVPMLVAVSGATVGVIVTTVSLGVLAVSARLSAAWSGLAPRGDPVDVAGRAAHGHATLSGLVAGCALGAAAGSSLLLLAHLDDGRDPLRRAAFTAVVAVALLLRVRVHGSTPRRILLMSSGLVCGTAALAMVAGESAVMATWCAVAIMGAGLFAGRLDLGSALGRGVDIVDYVALTAIIPLACWVGGVYAVARGWHST